MFAKIFRDDISTNDLRKAGLKNPELGMEPKKVPGTKPLNIFDPADYLKLRTGSDKTRADAGLLYHQAQHGMGWLPGGDMTGILGASLADFHPSHYITDITPQLFPGAVLKGERMKTKRLKTAQRSTVGGGFLMLDEGMVSVGRDRVSKNITVGGSTHVEHGIMSVDGGIAPTALRLANVFSKLPVLNKPEAAVDASDAVAGADAEEFGRTAMKEAGFGSVFKMNTHHDARGLFATGTGITPPKNAWTPGVAGKHVETGKPATEPGAASTEVYRPMMLKPGEFALERVKQNPDKSFGESLGRAGANTYDSAARAQAHADVLNKPAAAPSSSTPVKPDPGATQFATEPVSVGSTWNGGVKPSEATAGHPIPPKPAGPRPIHEIAREIRRIWSKQGKGVNYAAKPYLEAMGSLGSAKENYGADSGESIVAYFLGNATSFRGPDAKRLKEELKAHIKTKKYEVLKSIGPIKAGAFHAWLGKDPSEPITDADIERGMKAGGHPAKMAEFAKNARGWHHGGKKD
jgi:hypothetical protein